MNRRNEVAKSAGPDAETRVSAMLEGLRSAGLRLTPQRVAVVQELAADESHPTAQELFERLRPALSTMSFATVYNTLDTLQKARLCMSLSLSPGSGRFDPNVAPHDHVVCDSCGAVRDLFPDTRASAARAERGKALSMAAPGFQVRAVEQVVRGLCETCKPRRTTRAS